MDKFQMHGSLKNYKVLYLFIRFLNFFINIIIIFFLYLKYQYAILCEVNIQEEG